MGLARAYSPVLHFDDINGRPLVGGKLYTYAAGTSTPATTYSDKDGSEANTNPILLNERGECVVWLNDKRSYKFVLKDALDNTIWDADNVTIPAGEGGGPSPSEDILWGHWENTSKWVTIPFNAAYDEMFDMVTIGGTPKLVRTEGEIGPEGIPYLKAGLYDFKLEFAMQGTANVAEAIQYDLHIKYGSQQLRGMSFTFHDFGEEYFSYTEWCAGVFKMPEDGYVDIFVNKARGNYTEKVKVSHLFVHKID